MMLEDFLDSLGHSVIGTVDTIGDAMRCVGEGGFDVVIADVQLKDGEQIWPVADALAERNIPFVLATGGYVDPPPERHADAPMLAKPYTVDAIQPALEAAFAR